jgi:hypothetical protein
MKAELAQRATEAAQEKEQSHPRRSKLPHSGQRPGSPRFIS